MSSISWPVSMSRDGTRFWILIRIRSMTFWIGGRGKGLSLMKKSPVLASVMPPPSWVPVRNDHVWTAGSWLMICPACLSRRLVSLSEAPAGAR